MQISISNGIRNAEIPVSEMSIDECMEELKDASRIGKDYTTGSNSARELRRRISALRRDVRESKGSKRAPFMDTVIQRKSFERVLVSRFGPRISAVPYSGCNDQDRILYYQNKKHIATYVLNDGTATIQADEGHA